MQYIKFSAEDRNRTGTKVTLRRILSPVRLPVPPPRPLTSERRGSNPRPPPWQGGVLPLNYVRNYSECRLHDLNTRPSDYKSDALPTELSRPCSIPMRVKGLEPPRPKAPDPKSGASANSAKPAYDSCWARTSDPLIKSQLLYQLS